MKSQTCGKWWKNDSLLITIRIKQSSWSLIMRDDINGTWMRPFSKDCQSTEWEFQPLSSVKADQTRREPGREEVMYTEIYMLGSVRCTYEFHRMHPWWKPTTVMTATDRWQDSVIRGLSTSYLSRIVHSACSWYVRQSSGWKARWRSGESSLLTEKRRSSSLFRCAVHCTYEGRRQLPNCAQFSYRDQILAVFKRNYRLKNQHGRENLNILRRPHPSFNR